MARKLEEKKIELHVVYVSGGSDSIQKVFDESNYDEIEGVESSLETSFGSDDFGIDDIWVDGVSVNLKWENILVEKGRLNLELVSKIFEGGEEEFVKMQFLSDTGFDITPSNLEEVYLYDARSDNWVEGNFKSLYPDGWLEEQSEDLFSDLIKALDKVNGQSYFDWARLFSDEEVNGGFNSLRIGDYFVWSYNV
jgi:hypothetical protein